MSNPPPNPEDSRAERRARQGALLQLAMGKSVHLLEALDDQLTAAQARDPDLRTVDLARMTTSHALAVRALRMSLVLEERLAEDAFVAAPVRAPRGRTAAGVAADPEVRALNTHPVKEVEKLLDDLEDWTDAADFSDLGFEEVVMRVRHDLGLPRGDRPLTMEEWSAEAAKPDRFQNFHPPRRDRDPDAPPGVLALALATAKPP